MEAAAAASVVHTLWSNPLI